MYIVNITSTNLGALAGSYTKRVVNEVWMGEGSQLSVSNLQRNAHASSCIVTWFLPCCMLT